MKQELGIISTTDYNELILSSKELVDNRISLNLIVIKALPFISIGLFIFGCVILNIKYVLLYRRSYESCEIPEDKHF